MFYSFEKIENSWFVHSNLDLECNILKLPSSIPLFLEKYLYFFTNWRIWIYYIQIVLPDLRLVLLINKTASMNKICYFSRFLDWDSCLYRVAIYEIRFFSSFLVWDSCLLPVAILRFASFPKKISRKKQWVRIFHTNQNLRWAKKMIKNRKKKIRFFEIRVFTVSPTERRIQL